MLFARHCNLIETYHVFFRKFRLSYYPHLLDNFNGLVEKVFGKDAEHTVLGDYEPIENVSDPAYYVHIIKKKL